MKKGLIVLALASVLAAGCYEPSEKHAAEQHANQQKKLESNPMAEIHIGGSPIQRSFVTLGTVVPDDQGSHIVLTTSTLYVQTPLVKDTAVILRVEGNPSGKQFAAVRLSHPNWGISKVSKSFTLDNNGDGMLLISIGEAYKDHISIR